MENVDDWDLGIAPVYLKIYPLYFNSQISCSKGRRVPSSLAVKEPNIIALTETIGRMGLKFKVEPDKRHPKDPFTFGRVLIIATKSKNQILREIASCMVTEIPENIKLQKDLSLSNWEIISSNCPDLKFPK